MTLSLIHTGEKYMSDHVKFGVSDYEKGKNFFLKALEPLGVEAGSEGEPSYGIELCGRNNASLCLCQAPESTAPIHIAFVADTRQQVDAFYRAALDAGGQDNGKPGLRTHYHANYYAAFVELFNAADIFATHSKETR